MKSIFWTYTTDITVGVSVLKAYCHVLSVKGVLYEYNSLSLLAFVYLLAFNSLLFK
jgi:hypothetical protein